MSDNYYPNEGFKAREKPGPDYQEALERLRLRVQDRGEASKSESLSISNETVQRLNRDTEDLEDSEGFRKIRNESASADVSTTLNHEEFPNLKLPLKAFVRKAADLSTSAAEDLAHGGWKSSTWEFVRMCKTYPKLTSLTADEAFQAIPWQVTDYGEDEQMQFLVEWDSVRHIPGVSPIEWAAAMGRRRPLVSTRKQFHNYNRFVSLAGWLQVLVGSENPIFLPTRKVAKVLGLKSHVTVSTLCRLAVTDELLKVVEKHTQKRATRFRFAVERYQILTERQ